MADDPKKSGYSQENRLLRIDTVLDGAPSEQGFTGDPLLLVKLEGSEGISRLSGYDIVMLRDAGGIEGETGSQGQKRPPLDPKQLIGTHVKLGVRQNVDEELFLTRVGMFESFEDVLTIDVTHLAFFNVRDFHIYRARVVPWVKILTRDICYRVFEQKTVVEIIDAIAEQAKKTFPHVLIDTSALSGHDFPKMEYCVQFGENTLDFMCRLMARFGIWYYFGYKPSSEDLVINEWMILKGNWDHSAADTGRDVTIADKDPERDQIAKLVRLYRPPERRVAVGAFNYLNPAQPFYADNAVSAENDLMKPPEGGQPIDSKWLGSTAFAEPAFSWDDADVLASAASYSNQTNPQVISAVSKNPWFRAGHKFHVNEPPNFDPDDNQSKPIADLINTDLVIDSYSISVHDYNYVNLWGWQILDIFFSTYSLPGGDSQGASDTALAKVSSWVSNNAQNQVFPIALDKPGPPGQLYWSQEGNAGARTANLTWQVLSGMFWVLFQGIDLKKMIADNSDQASFACGITAFTATATADFPLPLAARPVARGPHTAVVIGDDNNKGVDTSAQDIYCDAIGRVRIRFPWDPGPPAKGKNEIPPVFPFEHPWNPTQVGGNTCWVRVVEGWAGRSYGTQFLPRIGQEVLVDFLDGDPERPVVTGRLYNADSTTTNLPFPDNSVKQTPLNFLDDLPDTARHDLRFSGIKTCSIPTKSAGTTRYHLTRWDDKYHCEQYLIRSQGRLDVTAFACTYATTYGNRHIKVAAGVNDETGQKYGGACYTTFDGEYDLHIGDSRYEQVEKNYELTVKGNVQVDIKGNQTEVVKGLSYRGANEIVIEATNKITLRVGASYVEISPCGVWINGPGVYINNPPGDPNMSPFSVSMTPVADAQPAEPGDQWSVRTTDCYPAAGGGTRNPVTDQINPAPPCTQPAPGSLSCDFLGAASGVAGAVAQGVSSVVNQVAGGQGVGGAVTQATQMIQGGGSGGSPSS